LPTLRPGAFSLEFRRSFGFLVPTAEAVSFGRLVPKLPAADFNFRSRRIPSQLFTGVNRHRFAGQKIR
jgi:hypothetical protein